MFVVECKGYLAKIVFESITLNFFNIFISLFKNIDGLFGMQGVIDHQNENVTIPLISSMKPSKTIECPQ